MNPEVKQAWLAALRSGEYRQGKGRLTVRVDGEERHCCLGVLCEVALDAGVEVERRWVIRHVKVEHAVYDYAYLSLPGAVRDWAGLDIDDPKVGADLGNLLGFLSTLNDSGLTLHEIADLIEEHL